ncbi:hypothetical protein CDG76_12180 [Nostoc sp. 'Peltigera membranacea cyanobiont' 210A]|nr:hypothetical protein CDG76_12180 [Nostoc sp. 'Peltigera membranacea cyanobiont' 210A]
MNFQYGWDDTFEEDLLKLQALFVNPSTEVFTATKCPLLYKILLYIAAIMVDWIFDFGKPVIISA